MANITRPDGLQMQLMTTPPTEKETERATARDGVATKNLIVVYV